MKGKSLTKMIKGEKGQALVVVMVMMLFGSLIIAPALAHVSSELKIGQYVYEERMHLLYAADSGVEYTLWQMQNDKLPDLFAGYDPYEYEQIYPPYTLPEPVNEKTVSVTFQNMWMPKDITAPEAGDARDIIEEGDLIIAGALAGMSETEYQIKIAFYWENESQRDSLRVEKMGIWLPSGFTYNGSCNLSGGCAPSSVDIEPYKSGQAVVWNFSSQPQLSAFPGGTSYPMVKTITFEFLGPEGQKPGAAVSWIDTIGVSGIDYTWDADVKVYAITSEASDESGRQTEVEAYAANIEMRKLGSAVSGDYCAVGDTLLTPTGSADYRNRLLMGGDDTIAFDDIPATATVQAAYLYWTGWIDFHYAHQVGSSWEWDEIEELIYPDDPTQGNLAAMVEDAAQVDRVLFGVSGDMTEVFADRWQTFESTGSDYEGTWIYTCIYDATDKVQQLIDDEKVSPNGAGTYVVRHAVVEPRVGYDRYYFELHDTGEYTGYPLGTPAHKLPSGERNYKTRYNYSHAGWSLVIIYSSPETKGHQLYLYDIENPSFIFTEAWKPGGIDNPDFDGDGSPGGMISGFIAPDAIVDEAYAARLTCFVGEGDEGIKYDYMQVNGVSLSNSHSPYYNVWNSDSPGLSEPGIDIDTFTVTYPTIEPGETWADVDLPTNNDGFTLIYIILSFRSKVTSGGTLSYLVR